MMGTLRAPTRVGALLLGFLTANAAAAAEDFLEQARALNSQLAAGASDVAKRGTPPTQQRMSPAERIAAAEILLRNRDWERAIQALSQVIELNAQGRASESARADAEYLIGEAYIGSEQFLSARRHFQEILRRAQVAPFDSYAGRAASRLVDIVLRTDNYSGLDELVARLESLPPSDTMGALQYARTKAYFAKGDYAKARESSQLVPRDSTYLPQALYIQGVMLAKQALAAPETAKGPGDATSVTTPAVVDGSRFAPAIEQFRAVTRLQVTTKEHQHVVDLSWLAIARLHYESDALLEAAEAYSKVGRESPEFSTMLYELAWVHARLGDYQRAQRALEVLSITDPESLKLADGSLLRADLMLRSGQFDKALNLYQGVRSRFEPIHGQVERFLKSNTDPSVFYDRLVADTLEQQSSQELSPLVVEWARQEVENERAFVVIDDVARSRDLVRRSRRLAAQLSGVLSSSTRAKAFPELKVAIERTLAALNRVSEVRLLVARGLDQSAGTVDSADIARVRPERRALMKRVAGLPVTDGDFARRETAGETQWNAVSQKLQQLTLEADKLAAIVNGLSRVLREAEHHDVKIDPASRERYQAEVDANLRDMEVYRQRIRQYQEAVETGRVQIGLGDSRYAEDAEVRSRFKQLLTQEVEFVGKSSGGSEAVGYARAAEAVLTQAAAVEGTLSATLAQLESEALVKAKALDEVVARESASVDAGAQRLDELDQLARLVVGQAAMANFMEVRDRLKSVVLRADVGIVQQAWEVREEQRTRVLNLQRERAREEQSLNDELREVLDDAEVTP
ncbi:MAG: tetratricopeptide repeat protein [Polyangiaceae bacterium]